MGALLLMKVALRPGVPFVNPALTTCLLSSLQHDYHPLVVLSAKLQTGYWHQLQIPGYFCPPVKRLFHAIIGNLVIFSNPNPFGLLINLIK